MEVTNECIRKHIKDMIDSDDVTPSMYINDVAKLFNGTIIKATERSDISHGFSRILFHLAHDDGLTQLQLVKFTHLTPPTISVALSKMEKAGYVKRAADKKDMRQMRVYLTDKGREHNDFIRQKCKETEAIMLDGISEDEQKQLCELMRKMLSNLWERM